MGDDNLLGNALGAGITLMVADKVLRPRKSYRTRRIKRKKRH